MQYFLKIQIQIARIGAQRLLGGWLAQSQRLQIAQDLLSEIDGQPVQFAADRCFVNAEQRSNFQQGSPIQIVGDQQKPLLGVQLAESLFNRSA